MACNMSSRNGPNPGSEHPSTRDSLNMLLIHRMRRKSVCLGLALKKTKSAHHKSENWTNMPNPMLDSVNIDGAKGNATCGAQPSFPNPR